MTATEDAVARRVAERLAGEGHPNLPVEVEGALAGGTPARPRTYVDPGTAIALANLVVVVAALAWTIYRDLKSDRQRPSPQALERRIRLELADRQDGPARAETDRVVTVTVEELLALEVEPD